MVADFLEAGNTGPFVMLVHSSVSGARQWRRLMDDLKGSFLLRAVNLFGYGKTPAWPNRATQSLDDQAMLVEIRATRQMPIKYVLSAIPLVALLP